MWTRVLVAVVAGTVVGALAACDRTTPGTVAMTTEPGYTTQSRSPSRPSTTPRTPRTPSPRTPSDTPPSGDALDVTCQQYIGLDEASRTALIEEILSDESSVLPPDEAGIGKTLADAVCTFLPTSTVSEILLGETPP